MTRIQLSLLAVLAATTTPAFAHEFKAGNIDIQHPYAYETAPTAMSAGGYLTLVNTGETPDRLLSVEAGFDRVMLHQSSEKDGVATMTHVEAIDLPAGSTVELAPGGYHVMFMGLGGDSLEDGEKIDATLVFEQAGRVEVQFNVEARGDTGGHGGMDHGDMEMSPGGIPLAEGGEDRDGLEMDVLQVRLGPVLRDWPAGLVLHCSLQGDVIVEAQAELVDGRARQDDDVVGPARGIDNIASLLALAGWDDAAAEARRIRDTALESGEGAAGSELERLRRRVRRSWTLRWSLRGVRRLSDKEAHARRLPADAVGDTYDRLMGMLDRAVAGVAATAAGDTGTRTNDAGRTLSTDHLAHLVMGLDLATARLVLASLDIHELLAGQAEHEVSHG